MTSSQPSSSAGGAVHSAASIGYSESNVGTYHSIRPGYPDEVAKYVLQHTLLSPDHPYHDGPLQRILDVGCGTGKWTATLHTALGRHPALKCELMAADPVPAMAATFAQQLPHIPIHSAAASQLPFGDEYFDLLTAATAFHWFCDDASVAALHRVLKPGACFAVVGYDQTVGNDWTEAMQQLVDSHYPADVPYPRHGQWRRALDKAEADRLFEPVAHTVFREAAVMRTDRAGMVKRFTSASRIAAMEEAQRARVTEQFNAIIDADGRFAGKTELCDEGRRGSDYCEEVQQQQLSATNHGAGTTAALPGCLQSSSAHRVDLTAAVALTVVHSHINTLTRDYRL